MSKKQVYEYAILRVVPNVEKEEFINVGVLLYSKHLKYLGCKIFLNEYKLLALEPNIDKVLIHEYLGAFEKIATGDAQSYNTIVGATMSDRFRWLTANRSTIIQASKLHTGLTNNAALELENLFTKYV